VQPSMAEEKKNGEGLLGGSGSESEDGKVEGSTVLVGA
jgi:hypothetical protein